jgi:hypothetical protein
MNQAIRLHVKAEMRKLQTVKTRLKKQTLLSGLQDHRRENKKDTLIRKIAIVTTGLLVVSVSAFAGDTATCKTVRFADVGWTDIQVTTGVAQVLLEALGYNPGSQDALRASDTGCNEVKRRGRVFGKLDAVNDRRYQTLSR